ncbi:hypothetical protein ACOME3_010259 [Neoechinorhynchus agilis]
MAGRGYIKKVWISVTAVLILLVLMMISSSVHQYRRNKRSRHLQWPPQHIISTLEMSRSVSNIKTIESDEARAKRMDTTTDDDDDDDDDVTSSDDDQCHSPLITVSSV